MCLGAGDWQLILEFQVVIDVSTLQGISLENIRDWFIILKTNNILPVSLFMLIGYQCSDSKTLTKIKITEWNKAWRNNLEWEWG